MNGFRLGAHRPPFEIGSVASNVLGVLREGLPVFLSVAAIVNLPLIALYAWRWRRIVAGDADNDWEALATLLQMILQQFTIAALIYGVFEVLQGRPPSVNECVRRGVRGAGRAWLTGLLVGLATALGLLMCIVPGVYVSVLYAVAVPVAVIERKGALDSMSQSRELARGHGWPILGLNLLFNFSFVLIAGVGLALVSGSPGLAALWSVGTTILLSAVNSVLPSVMYFRLRAADSDLDLLALVKVFE
jgi:hypothetical protein